MRERGAEDPSFPSIVASGRARRAAARRAARRARSRADTLVIVDMGAASTATARTARARSPPATLDDEAAEVYELVLAAQEESLAAVRAGAEGRAVDAVARDRIDAAGHGEHFGHGLGHGVGLEVHEAPRAGADRRGAARQRATW